MKTRCIYLISFYCLSALVAACSDPTNDPPVPPSNTISWSSIFDKERIVEIRLNIDEEHWNKLRFERRVLTEIFGNNCEEGLGESPYNYYPAQLSIDSVSIGQVGLRTKGLLGSINPTRPSFKIKFQEYNPDLTFEDEKRLTLNNQNQDASRLRTCLSYYIFDAAGVPTPRCNFAHITLNGSDFGTYANVEPIKKPFLRRAFGDDSGNLYEGTASDIRAGGFMARIEKKTNELEDDWSDIHQLRDAIEAPQETFLSDLEAILNVDAFITFWAAEALVGHWDGFSGNKNNYYTYKNPADGKFHFIPWGTDATFHIARGGFSPSQTGDPVSVMAAAKLTRRLWEIPAMRSKYEERMENLLATIWNETDLLAELDRIKVLIAARVHPNHQEAFITDAGKVREYLLGRSQQIRSEFASGAPDFVSQIDSEFRCMSKQGEVHIDLSTTYGTEGTPNAFLTGSGAMSGNIYGWELEVAAMGATAGTDPNGADPSLVKVTAVGYLAENDFLIGSINLPSWLVAPNTTVPINGQDVTAWFVRFRPPDGVQMLGFVGGGEISFNQAATTDGAAIVATVQLDVWGDGDSDDNEDDDEGIDDGSD